MVRQAVESQFLQLLLYPQALYEEERKNREASAESAMRGAHKASSAIFVRATHVEHVRPMFKEIWTPVMAGLTQPLMDHDEPQIVSLCLEGVPAEQ